MTDRLTKRLISLGYDEDHIFLLTPWFTDHIKDIVNRGEDSDDLIEGYIQGYTEASKRCCEGDAN